MTRQFCRGTACACAAATMCLCERLRAVERDTELPRIELRVCHLYARFLNIYGDRGNIITLVQRASWRGYDVITKPFGLGETLDPDWADIYFVGGGQDRQQLVVAEDLRRQAQPLKEAVDWGRLSWLYAVVISFSGTTTSPMTERN